MNFAIYDDSLNLSAHVLFTSYFYSLQNILKTKNEEIKKLTDINEVNTGDRIFVIDDHYHPNAVIYMNPHLIAHCNKYNICVIFFTTEKMLSPFWDHTNTIQKQSLFNNTKHYYGDALDIEKFKCDSFIVKQKYSQVYEPLRQKLINKPKLNEIVFIGQLEWIDTKPWYSRRKEILKFATEQCDIKINLIKSDSKRTYLEYLNILSNYKYIINPLGIGDFFNIRYYDTLFVNSIPIQQYTPAMKRYYNEIDKSNGLFFTDINDLSNIFKTLKDISITCNHTWLEEYMIETNFTDKI